MKSTVLLAGFTLCSLTSVFAKSGSMASHISVGPVVSLGHGWITDAPNHTDFKLSPAAGIGLVYSRNIHWGVGTQLLVSHEGFKEELPAGNGNNYDVTYNPVYPRLPVQVIYFFGNYGNRVRPKIYAGPSFALKVDEKHFYNNDESERAMNANDIFKRADVGLSAGVGANIRLSRLTWLNLDAGYYNGIIDAANGYRSNMNRNIRLNVGLMWGL